MQPTKIIGIDLGTTNSAVSVIEGNVPTIIPNDEGRNTTPSVVAFLKDGERKVGDPAKRQAVINPKNTIASIKRFMGKSYKQVNQAAKHSLYPVEQGPNDMVRIRINERLYSPEEIFAIVAQKMKAAAEAYLGTSVTKAVITVPAYFNDAERQATKHAGEIAGLEVVRIINEPTAAALAYGLDKRDKDLKIAVIDLGGGTFDNSILELGGGVFEVKATNGDVHLGGDNFDKTIIDHLADEFLQQEGVDLRKDLTALQRLKEAAERAKIELSSSKQAEINLPYITVKDHVPKHLVKTLTRARFENLIDKDICRVRQLCQEVLQLAKLQPKDIDEVILVGGSTRIPKVQQIVEEVFAKKPSKGVNPDEVVAMGAAIQGAIIGGHLNDKDIVLLDVTPLSLGIETMGGVFTKLIEANTTIPTKRSNVFSTAQDNQSSVEIHVLQGERSMAKDNRTIGRFHLDGIKPAPRGRPQIEVGFDIDSNGILSVSAKDKDTGKEQQIRIEASSGLSKEDIERMKQDAKMNEMKDKEEKEKVEKLNAADALILRTENQLKEYGDKLSTNHKEAIEEALTALKKSYEQKDLATIATNSKNLEKAWTDASDELYKAMQEKQPKEVEQQQQPDTTTSDQQEDSSDKEADFEEVDK
jgi:molecular chaperone DnaK